MEINIPSLLEWIDKKAAEETKLAEEGDSVSKLQHLAHVTGYIEVKKEILGRCLKDAKTHAGDSGIVFCDYPECHGQAHFIVNKQARCFVHRSSVYDIRAGLWTEVTSTQKTKANISPAKTVDD